MDGEHSVTDGRGKFLLVGIVVLITGVVTLATVLGAFVSRLDEEERRTNPGRVSSSYLTGEMGSVVT